MIKFGRLKMKEFKSIDEFGGKQFELVLKLVVLGVVIEEIKFVKKFFMSLF